MLLSLGNDPRQVPSREEPEPEECRTCDGRTYDPARICPDCRHEGVGRNGRSVGPDNEQSGAGN